MVRHNNMISYGHFHKQWQGRIKTWFNQPMEKVRRKNYRTKKQNLLAPMPIYLLRPSVNCPSVRYNNKLRTGRGFTLQELKQSGINRNFARTIGIAVDQRRRNRCLESIFRNAQRLKDYRNRLIMFSKKLEQIIKTDTGKNLNKIKTAEEKLKAAIVTDDDKKFEAYVTLRRGRCDAKFAGVRIKKKQVKKEAIENVRNQ